MKSYTKFDTIFFQECGNLQFKGIMDNQIDQIIFFLVKKVTEFLDDFSIKERKHLSYSKTLKSYFTIKNRNKPHINSWGKILIKLIGFR